jgi:hypothetical protein
MYPRLSLQKGLLLAIFLITGIIAGIVFVTSKVNGDIFLGGLVGFTISLVLSCFLFSELRNIFGDNWNAGNIAGFNLKTYLTHPTQKPLAFAALWFIIFILFLSSGLSDSLNNYLPDNIKQNLAFIFLFPIFLLFGFSGFLMIRLKEGVSKFGQTYNGPWVYFNGALAIIFGWGGLLFMVLAYFFNW